MTIKYTCSWCGEAFDAEWRCIEHMHECEERPEGVDPPTRR